jgi:hypothetical protein
MPTLGEEVFPGFGEVRPVAALADLDDPGRDCGGRDIDFAGAVVVDHYGVLDQVVTWVGRRLQFRR